MYTFLEVRAVSHSNTFVKSEWNLTTKKLSLLWCDDDGDLIAYADRSANEEPLDRVVCEPVNKETHAHAHASLMPSTGSATRIFEH